MRRLTCLLGVLQLAFVVLLAGLCAAGVTAEYVAFTSTDVTSYGASVLNPTTVTIMPGLNLGGPNVWTDGVTSASACANLCVTSADCHWFTFDSLGKRCFRRSQYSLPAQSNGWYAGAVHTVPYPTGDTDLLKALCEETSGCDTLDGAGMLRSFASNSSVNSWISNTTCGASGPASVTPGSCFTASASYVTCSDSLSGVMEPFAHFDLPPFLVQKSCDSNPACAGYMTAADGTQGWLLQWASGSGGVAAVRVDGRDGR